MDGMTMANHDREWNTKAPGFKTTMIDKAGELWESQETFEDLEDAKEDVRVTLECDDRYASGFVSNLNGIVVFKTA